MRKNKVDIITLGCSKNLVDSEQLMRQFAVNGYKVEHDPHKINGEIVVVNTCGFIGDAQEESIEMILELGQAKKQGKIGKLFVMGCLSERFLHDLEKELPEVDRFYGKFNWKELISDLGKAYHQELAYDRILTTPKHYAYLKIAEGCDNHCAYCVIPSLRGKYRSRPMNELLDEAAELASAGVKELIVIAQDITRYGTDLNGEHQLAKLLKELCKLDFHWIRLHYLYPTDTTDELIDVIASEPKIVKYLDIPIQHCNDTILKAMNRRDTKADLLALLKKLREKVPGLVLRTSLIAGLPYEDDAAFEELCDFLREVRIERAGVFPFSPEEGTKAALMEHVDMEEAQRRAELAVDVQSDIIDAYNDSILGEEREVLCEGYDSQAQMFYGRSYAESPDIDGRIWFTADSEIAPGSFVNVRLTGTMDGETTGELV